MRNKARDSSRSSQQFSLFDTLSDTLSELISSPKTDTPEDYYQQLTELSDNQEVITTLKSYIQQALLSDASSNNTQQNKAYHPGNDAISLAKLLAVVAQHEKDSNTCRLFFVALEDLLEVKNFAELCKATVTDDLTWVAYALVHYLSEKQLALVVDQLLKFDSEKSAQQRSSLLRGNGITEKILIAAARHFGTDFCMTYFNDAYQAIIAAFQLEWQQNQNTRALIQQIKEPKEYYLFSMPEDFQFSESFLQVVFTQLETLLLTIKNQQDALPDFIKYTIVSIHNIFTAHQEQKEKIISTATAPLITRYIGPWIDLQIQCYSDNDPEQFFIKNMANQLILVPIQTLATGKVKNGNSQLNAKLTTLFSKHNDLIKTIIRYIIENNRLPETNSLTITMNKFQMTFHSIKEKWLSLTSYEALDKVALEKIKNLLVDINTILENYHYRNTAILNPSMIEAIKNKIQTCIKTLKTTSLLKKSIDLFGSNSQTVIMDKLYKDLDFIKQGLEVLQKELTSYLDKPMPSDPNQDETSGTRARANTRASQLTLTF